jgi:segregation and condensation protein B
MRSMPTKLGSRLSSTALRYQAGLPGSRNRGFSSPWPIVFRKNSGFFSPDSGCLSPDAGQATDLHWNRDAKPESGDIKIARLEAVLFLSRQPLPSRKLAKLANLADGTEARALVRKLQDRYNRRESAIQVMEVAGGLQLLTRPQLAHWLGRLHGQPDELRLSTPAMETLSVVAYRQPVVRAEIEVIRGVQCGEILRVLMERDLLRIVGRSEDLGRPFLYGTTTIFLRVFGLRRLEDLPPIDQNCNHVKSVANRAA